MVTDELGAPVHPERYSDEFARLCREAGVPDHVRAAWCGHTVAVNVATYTHARPEDLGQSAERHPRRHVTDK